MKILFLCHFFPPSHTAGAENYTFNLARVLTNRGPTDTGFVCWYLGQRGALLERLY